MHYWTLLYTEDTWREFLRAGGAITGFPERRWELVQQCRPGDLLLCYLTGLSRYVGVLEVSGEPFLGYKAIWAERLYPARLPVKIRLELPPEYGIPVQSLAEELSYFQNLGHPRAWTHHFRSSPVAESPPDAEAILHALEQASEDPTYREVDPRKFPPRPSLYESAAGAVTIPEGEADEDDEPGPVTHTAIQHLLLSLGSAMGLEVWVARNDRGRAYEGQAFAHIPRLLPDLPRQFDPATQRTIELIDVLWLRGGAILAAFEIEHSTSVYSGLLRLADLVAMQPNLNMRLYIVAPDERRGKVLGEINRPAFARLGLNRLCYYLPYGPLREKAAQVRGLLPYLQPEFLHDIAEGVELEL